MLFDLKSYRQALYPVWKYKKLLRGIEPLPEPEEIREIKTHRIESGYLKWLGIWLAVVFLICCSMRCAHAEDINLDIIADIESGGNPLAYNRESGAIGEYQITDIVLDDFNQQLHEKYTVEEIYKTIKNKIVANWYINYRIPNLLDYYKIPDNITSRLIAYNWGIGHLRKWFKHGSYWNQLPRETRNYIKKYFKEVKENE